MVLRNSSSGRSLFVFGKLDHSLRLAPSLLQPSIHITELHFKLADAASLDLITTFDWPRIQAIHLSSSRSFKHIRTQCPVHTSFFRAHTLILNGIEIPISSLSSFRGLRSLVLRYDTFSAPFVLPMQPFLSLLRDQKRLESMKLTVPFTVTPDLPLICLPSLTTLHLEGAMADMVALISSMRVPLLRRLRLFLTELDRDEHRLVAVFKLARALSITIGVSPSIIQTQSCGLFYEQSSAVSIRCGDANASLRLVSSHHAMTISRHLACAIRGFGGSHILTLELDASSNNTSEPYIEPTVSWIDVLANLPNLTDISISNGGYGVENLPVALESPTSYGLVCPRAVNLHFAEGIFRPLQCEAWVHCLEQRQALGVTLSMLTFRNCIFPEDFVLDRFDKLCHILVKDTLPPASPSEFDSSEAEDEEDRGRFLTRWVVCSSSFLSFFLFATQR